MSRARPVEPKREPNINWPRWWVDAVIRARDREQWSDTELAARVNEAVRHGRPFHRTTVENLTKGKGGSIRLMEAVRRVFPTLPPPLFFANTYEEALRLSQAAREYEENATKADEPAVSKTVEDTGQESPKPKTRVTAKRARH